ncbi:MAG: four helix bundle protein [Ignavibacteria bacterium]|jgi:four helix bundle protein
MLELNHKKLDVWKVSITLVKMIYNITNTFPKNETYGISNQLRRAAISVASNIAEGASRKSAVDRKRFFEISRSSLVEIDTQMEICIEIGYIDKSNLKEIDEIINKMFAKLSNLISSTK